MGVLIFLLSFNINENKKDLLPKKRARGLFISYPKLACVVFRNIGQVSVKLGTVKTVADNEMVGYSE